MTALNEPADGGYVCVQYAQNHGGTLVYRRDDEAAAGSDEHWFCTDDSFGRVLTWEQLTLTGPIAYVGEFVDRRSEVEA